MRVVTSLIVLGLAGLGLIVTGIHVVFGLGASLIAGGIAILLTAAFVRSGITPNG